MFLIKHTLSLLTLLGIELVSIPKASAGCHTTGANPWDFSIDICCLFGGSAVCLNLPTVQGNLFNFFILAAFEVCTGALLLGCLFMVLSGGSQTLLEKGKSIIKGSLIGYAVIGGSFIILRAATWVLYSG